MPLTLWQLSVLAIFSSFILLTLIVYIYHLLHDKRAPLTNKRIALIIAHPDDECMFFGPILCSLAKHPTNRFHVLCLTIGDFNGLGQIRRKELKSSLGCLIDHSSLSDLTLVNEPELPDNPRVEWNSKLCEQIISDYIKTHSIDVVLTFDQSGVSGHANHCFLYKSVKTIQQSFMVNRSIFINFWSCQ